MDSLEGLFCPKAGLISTPDDVLAHSKDNAPCIYGMVQLPVRVVIILYI